MRSFSSLLLFGWLQAAASLRVALPALSGCAGARRCAVRCEATDKAESFDPAATVISTAFQAGSGRRIAWGVLTEEVDPASVPSDAERQALRDTAAANLVNIDQDERDRRRVAGTALSVATAALAIGLLAVHADAVTRAATLPPVFLASGFLASAEEGL